MKSSDELNKRCGQRLKECRETAGITQEKLATATNYSVQTISYIENGKRSLSSNSARLFAKYLKVRMEYLLCEDNVKTIKDLHLSALSIQMKEHAISDAITGLGYLPLEVEGDNLGEYFDPDSEENYSIASIEKYIILSPNNDYIVCSEEKYVDMLDEIHDFIKLKLKRLFEKSAPATTSDIEYFKSIYEMDDKNL